MASIPLWEKLLWMRTKQRFCCSVTKSCPTFCNPMAVARQASLSFTVSRSLLRFRSIESVRLSNHLIFCCPLLLLPSIFPSIRVFFSEWLPSGDQSPGHIKACGIRPCIAFQDWQTVSRKRENLTYPTFRLEKRRIQWVKRGPRKKLQCWSLALGVGKEQGARVLYAIKGGSKHECVLSPLHKRSPS